MKSGFRKVPMLGKIAMGVQTLFIDRFSKQGRSGAFDQIKKHASNHKLPPLVNM